MKDKKNSVKVDLDVIKKYDRPGPRYTSYPTVPQFHRNFTSDHFKQEILKGNTSENAADISLYFHLPFCESLCYYCACNNIVTKNRQRIDDYIIELKKEIDLFSRVLSSERPVVQMHWGGGTPTYLSACQIEELYQYISDRFRFTEDAEISIEIDPRRLSRDHLPTLKRLGFNRVSFGVQDFHEKVQQAVNRLQPESLSRSIVQQSRDLGFESINIDLIYGLPHQTYHSYQVTLEKVIDIDPDRLAVFNFAHVPWMKKHQNLLPAKFLPAPEEKLWILKAVIENLTSAGYVFIGMDHFAKPEDELSRALKNHTLYRNFQGYTTRAGAEVFAFGITGISQLKEAYAQNTRELNQYKKFIDEGKFATVLGRQLDRDDCLRREVITELMCNNRIDKPYFEEKYGINFDTYFTDSIDQLAEFVEDDLLSISNQRIQVNGAGRLIVRNIAMCFDKYLLNQTQPEKNIYSRTV